MEEDEEFGDYAEPRLCSFFHEAVSQPKVGDWLKFSDQTYRAEDPDARRIFYELLSPRELDGVIHPPKLQNANRQVRQQKDIVDKPVPLKVLADPEKTFDEAVQAADAEIPQETGMQPSIDAWLAPNDRAKQKWADLVSVIDKIRGFMPSP